LSRLNGRPVKIRDLGDFGLVARIKDRLPTLPSSVVKGFGEEDAVFSPPPGKNPATAGDLLVEGVHFYFPLQPPDVPARKLSAPEMSEIAAAGDVPPGKKMPERGRRWK
jgi:thiamine-monophosphate kinase